MARPKVGDKVRISNDAGLKEGKVGTVVEDDGTSMPFRVEFSTGERYWFYERQVTKEHHTYKVGDRTIQVSHGGYSDAIAAPGTLGTVTSLGPAHTGGVNVRLDSYDGGPLYMYQNEVKPYVREEKTAQIKPGATVFRNSEGRVRFDSNGDFDGHIALTFKTEKALRDFFDTEREEDDRLKAWYRLAAHPFF